jgi:hypothetical protein
VTRSFISSLMPPLAALAWMLAATACGGPAPTSGPPPTGEASGQAAAATEAPVAPVPAAAGSYEERSLEELAPEAVSYLLTRDGPAGVAVVVPAHHAIYSWNGEAQFHMASVAKVAIMLTVMDQAIREGRQLTADEMDNLRPMITVSDNASASLLWSELGGGDAVERYLRSIGLEQINPNKEGCWGASYASPHDVALLFTKLATGEILNEDMRTIALGLLQQVDPSQTWGVTAAARDDRPEGSIVAVKDGWYPADCGWWVNSAGLLVPADERPGYSIAVLTGEQKTWEYGIETIEAVSEMVHARLHGN